LELLDKEIPKYKDEIKFVHLSFMTDPFMYGYEEVGDLSLKIIEKLNINNIRCTVLTKGIYPRDLVNMKKYSRLNEYGVTLVSLDENFKRKYEPYAAPFEKRIASLKYLHNHGLKTWVSIEPYPTPNIVNQDLKKILNKISFVDKIIFGKLNYNVKISEFGDNKSFYDGLAVMVKDFCKKNYIDCHIKFGTQTVTSVEEIKIFKVSKQQKLNTVEPYCVISKS
jgi:DNA repair photolyase